MKDSKGLPIIRKAIGQLFTELKNGVSGNYLKYLDFKAKFHNYSFGNSILIALQRPGATFVKGYRQWQEMGYHVKKGEKGIGILAPLMLTMVVDGDDIRPARRGEPLEGKEVIKKLYGFKDVYVFDIDQTDCKEYPKFFYQLGNDNKVIYYQLLKIFDDNKIKVVEVDIDGLAQGYYQVGADKVCISKDIDTDNKLLTLLHEVAHKLCHDRPDYKDAYSYSEGEAHAESVAYIVSKYLGVRNPFTTDYLINWGFKTVADLEKQLDVISQVSEQMIDMIKISNAREEVA